MKKYSINLKYTIVVEKEVILNVRDDELLDKKAKKKLIGELKQIRKMLKSLRLKEDMILFDYGSVQKKKEKENGKN